MVLEERTGKNMDLGLFSIIEREISVRIVKIESEMQLTLQK